MNKLIFMWINLQQFIVFEQFENDNVINPVVCIGHVGKKVLVFDPMKKIYVHQAKSLIYSRIPHKGYEVIYGDGFHIDTWDDKIMDFPMK